MHALSPFSSVHLPPSHLDTLIKVIRTLCYLLFHADNLMNGFSVLVYTSDTCWGHKLYLDHVTCCDFAPEITLRVRLMGKKIKRSLSHPIG